MADGFKVTVERVSGGPPSFDLGSADWSKIGNIVVASVLQNIKQQKTARGEPIKENAPATKRMKLNRGRGSRSLVDDPKSYRFYRNANFAVEADARGVTVYPRDLRVSRFVQLKGYVGWLALNKAGWVLVRKILKAAILGASRR